MPRRVFLSPKLNPQAYKGSRTHNSYVGSTVAVPGGLPQPLHKLTFINGVATNVDESLYERFKDAGLADTSRPKRPATPDEDEDDA